jgi:drug/metabolite transporter (DMT)-like permease
VNRRRSYARLLLAVACVSIGSILVRLARAPALAVAFHRVFLASLVTAPFASRSLARTWAPLAPSRRLLLLGSGAALGLHFATWIASLSFTGVAASVLLVNTAPVFTLGFSRTFLGEGVSPPVMTAMAAALGGASLIAAGDWAKGTSSLLGDALALAGACTLSVHHVIGRGLRDALPLGAYLLGVWATAALALALLALAAHVPLYPYPPRTVAALVGLALAPTVLGHGLVNRSLRDLPAPTVGLFLLGEPIGATLLAYAVFHEVPGAYTMAGGALILASLALVVRSEGA